MTRRAGPTANDIPFRNSAPPPSRYLRMSTAASTAVVVTTEEFLQNQDAYFERVDAGEEVLLRRGESKLYELRAREVDKPIDEDDELIDDEDDEYFSPEMVAKIKASHAEAKAGNYITLRSREDIKAFLGL